MVKNRWLQGYPAQAEQRAEKIIETAGQIDRLAALAVVHGWAASVFLWTGNWQKAEKHIGAIVYHAETNSLGPFVAVGRARMSGSFRPISPGPVSMLSGRLRRRRWQSGHR
jgi:hypothetical protein